MQNVKEAEVVVEIHNLKWKNDCCVPFESIDATITARGNHFSTWRESIDDNAQMILEESCKEYRCVKCNSTNEVDEFYVSPMSEKQKVKYKYNMEILNFKKKHIVNA